VTDTKGSTNLPLCCSNDSISQVALYISQPLEASFQVSIKKHLYWLKIVICWDKIRKWPFHQHRSQHRCSLVKRHSYKVTFRVHVQNAITHNSVKETSPHTHKGQKPRHHILKIQVTAKHEDSFLHYYIFHFCSIHREVNPCLPEGQHWYPGLLRKQIYL
jgi:hypothetical protein